jgi:hypothetical protein
MRRLRMMALGLAVVTSFLACGDDGARRGAVLGAAQLLRTLPAPQGGGHEELARVHHMTEVAAFGGHAVWNERRRSGWILVHATSRRVERLPLAAGRAASAIDLGPGPDGTPTLVYSRCDQPAECAVHAYDLRRNTDRRLTELDRAGTVVERASIWGGDIAFVRRTIGSAHVDVLLRDGATGRLDDIPSEPPVTCWHGARPGRYCRAEIQSLDLGAELLAHSWTGRFEADYSVPGTPHVMRRSDGADRRLFTGYISGACGSLEGNSVQVHGHTVQYIRRLYNCSYESSYLRRYDFATRRTTRVNPPPLRRGNGIAHAMARDGRETYWLYVKRNRPYETHPDTCNAGNGGDCRMLRSRDLRFTPAQPGDPRPSDGAQDGSA